jgi:hypothetical protein
VIENRFNVHYTVPEYQAPGRLDYPIDLLVSEDDLPPEYGDCTVLWDLLSLSKLLAEIADRTTSRNQTS